MCVVENLMTWSGRGRGRRRFQAQEASNQESTDQTERKCAFCDKWESETPFMRSGPSGPLCNACGLKWSKQKPMGGGRHNVSEEESTDQVDVFDERGIDHLSRTELASKLHLSDAKGLKWQKIADERSEKNKELMTEIECLNIKIKEITGRGSGPSEVKLRAEIQALKEHNSQLMHALDRVRKTITVEMATHTKQDNTSSQQNGHHLGSNETWNAGRNGHESITEVNIGKGEPNNSHQQVSKRTGNSGRKGYESGREVDAITQDKTSSHHDTLHDHFGRNAFGHGPTTEADCGTHKGPYSSSKKSEGSERNRCDSKADVNVVDIGGQSSEDEGCPGHPAGRPEQPTKYGNLRPEETADELLTAMQRRSALKIVDQEFLMWINDRVRRPTRKEMSYHKSEFQTIKDWHRVAGENPHPFYWTGIPGSSLLEKFIEETGMEKPPSQVLTDLLKTELGVVGCKRPEFSDHAFDSHDTVWCLVWTDCRSPEQLPGYSLKSQESKRNRLQDPEDAMRSTKLRRTSFS